MGQSVPCTCRTAPGHFLSEPNTKQLQEAGVSKFTGGRTWSISDSGTDFGRTDATPGAGMTVSSQRSVPSNTSSRGSSGSVNCKKSNEQRTL